MIMKTDESGAALYLGLYLSVDTLRPAARLRPRSAARPAGGAGGGGGRGAGVGVAEHHPAPALGAAPPGRGGGRHMARPNLK